MTQQDIILITAAYSKEELARKYILAQEDVMRLEKEKKELEKEMYQWRIARPVGCPECHRGCFSIDKFCGHCGTKLK